MKILIFFVFGVNICFAQNRVPFDKLTLENDLVYENFPDKLFTGNAAKISKNGHVVYEDIIQDGKTLKRIVYYNKSNLPAIESIYFENSHKIKKEIQYSLKESRIDITQFNELGEKTLSEIYENDKLIYRCEFVKNKKNGREFCIDKNGQEIITEYENGKPLN